MILLVIPISYGSSTITNAFFSVHEPPAITLNTPANDTTVTDLQATLNYTLSDPDGDGIYCDIYGDNQSDPTTLLNITGLLISGTYQYNWGSLIEQQYYWRINCTDTRGASSTSDTYTFLVDYNDPPYFTDISNITATEGDLVNITVNASDPENDPLTFHYSYPLNSTGQWQTGYADAGNYSVNVTVSDGENNVTESIIVSIQNYLRKVNMSLNITNSTNGNEYNISLSDTGFNNFGNVTGITTLENRTSNKTANFSLNTDYYILRLDSTDHHLIIKRVPVTDNILLLLRYDEDVTLQDTDIYRFKKTVAVQPEFNHSNATICFDMTKFTFSDPADAYILTCSYSFSTGRCISANAELASYADGNHLCVDVSSFSAFSLAEKKQAQKPGGGGSMGGGGMTTPGRVKEEIKSNITGFSGNETEEREKYEEEPKIVSKIREMPVIGKMLEKVPPIKRGDIRKEVMWFFLIGLVSIGFISNYIYSYRSQAAEMISDLHRRLDEMLRKK
ncbi:hypothetical protein JW968_01655 [Candidatus Woesearchaeota archaeon]|nr:hypothetical protein [Candidatus Woesearchaeota archaeon]